MRRLLDGLYLGAGYAGGRLRAADLRADDRAERSLREMHVRTGARQRHRRRGCARRPPSSRWRMRSSTATSSASRCCSRSCRPRVRACSRSAALAIARGRGRLPRVLGQPLHLRELGLQRHRAAACCRMPMWIPQLELRARLAAAADRGARRAGRRAARRNARATSSRSRNATRTATSPPTSSTPHVEPPIHGHPRRRRHPAGPDDGAARRRRLDRDDAGDLRLGRPGVLHHHRAGQEPVLVVLGIERIWELAALPLFIWMGEILFRTKLSEQMFEGLRAVAQPRARAG